MLSRALWVLAALLVLPFLPLSPPMQYLKAQSACTGSPTNYTGGVFHDNVILCAVDLNAFQSAINAAISAAFAASFPLTGGILQGDLVVSKTGLGHNTLTISAGSASGNAITITQSGTGGISVTGATSISGGLSLSGIPTTCSGHPAGTVASISGTLTLC